MSNVFITGVAGFLGSHLADRMLAEGHKVWGCDNLIGGYRDNVPTGVTFWPIDCNHISSLAAAMGGCDVVYHCAATAYEGLSVFSPAFVTTNIVSASASVFSAAVKNKVKRVVLCSSMARYGKGMRDPLSFAAYGPPFHESYTPNPQDPYGIGKVAAEQLLRNICDTHGVEWSIAVPHNIIGPRQKYDDPYRNVASIMMNMMLQDRQPVIYGDGQQERCFSFVGDCVDCLTQMAFSDAAKSQVINIGPDEHPVTINQLFAVLKGITGYDGDPQHFPDRPQEVKVAVCSSAKARRVLGYQTKTSLHDGLVEMHSWMKARGPRPFQYHLPLEIVTDKTPRTWVEKVF